MDFIPLVRNGMDKSIARENYKPELVIEASDEQYFKKLPNFNKVIEVLVGDLGTEKTIFEFKDGFASVEKTIKVEKI